MTKTENFFTQESVERKIKELMAKGINYSKIIVEEMNDYGSICDGITTSYTQVSWEE